MLLNAFECFECFESRRRLEKVGREDKVEKGGEKVGEKAGEKVGNKYDQVRTCTSDVRATFLEGFPTAIDV